MSNDVYSLAKKRKVGSPTVKSVLMLMADSASDDGSGIWLSKANMARDMEMGKRTVQMAIQTLIEMGLVSEVGQKPCKNGFTYEYRINISVLYSLPSTRAGDAPVQEMHVDPCTTCTPTRAGDAPNPSLEPSLEPSIMREEAHDLFSENPTVEQKPKDRFDEFWSVYPKKADRPSAMRAWVKAIKRADPQAIIDGAKRYARTETVERGFTKNPQGWLNGDRWNDTDLPPLPVAGAPSSRVRQNWGEVVR